MQARFEHATDDVLELYSLGVLQEAETEILEEHLLICSDCQNRLQEADEYVRHMRAAASRLRAGKARRPTLVSGRLSLAFTGQRLAAVSVILCCLLVLGWAVTARMRFIPVSGPPVAVVLRASRGPGDSPAAAVPQGRAFILQADVTGLPDRGPCDLEIVDAEGRPVTRSRMRPEGGLMTAAVTGLGSGGYWVRLYAPGSRTELLQEYALRVE